jgi:tRNA threonylcarbamoyl adenosine modification protein (Sua5/YciO/YrdC/YwlC family)
MKIYKTWSSALDERQLSQIVAAIEMGELIIWPTDTLYGIACDALNVKAIERLCALKGLNPTKQSLSIICSDISQASTYARWDNNAFPMLRDNTPGPFTFLFKAASTLPKAFKGRKIVGIRIPDCEICRQITERLGHPMLTTSIDFNDEDYAINPDLIVENYDRKVDLFIDNGDGGTLPSTVIDCTQAEFEIVREGKGELQ